jgi:hypothetical protein
VLRLIHELGLSVRQVREATGVGKTAVSVNNRQRTCVGAEGNLIGIGAELNLRSDKSRHFGGAFRSMMSNGEVLRYEVVPRQHAANS